ncbi:putative amino acid transporter [Xylariaceae sp. FL0016]|nr:putative amino acid transporter [Xylariaceae sp. FL0016]
MPAPHSDSNLSRSMSKNSKNEGDLERLGAAPSNVVGEIHSVPEEGHDAVFGDLNEKGPNYRNVGWLGSAVLMMKTQIGLGVLSIPSNFDTLGIVPGVICLLLIAGITTWSGHMVGVFKLNHREIYGIDDTMGKILGPWARNVFGVIFVLYWIFVAGSGMLSVSIGLNSVSTHGTCTAVFVAVAAIIGFSLASIRTFGKISFLAWLGVISILTSIWTVTIAVGVQDHPAAAPAPAPGTQWVSDYKIVNNPSFTKAAAAISSLVFSYAAPPAFFSIAAEMKEPRQYTKALLLCQGVVSVTYVAIGCVVYYFCGSYVASPALGSAGVTIKKACYGIALPGLIVSTTIVTHLPAKYVFVRILRGSRHLVSNSLVHWGTWFACTFSATLIAYIIASAIPVFSDLVSLIGALFGTLLCFQPMGAMWLYDNWGQGKTNRSPRWVAMVCWSVFVILSGTFLMIAGTYGSAVSIKESYAATGGSAAWSCADNSNST